MGIQQLADINLGGAKQTGVDHKAKSKALSADEAQQSPPFKDEVKKQLDQAKADAHHDKNDDNQELIDKDATKSVDDSNANTEVQVSENSEVEGVVESETTKNDDAIELIEQEISAFTSMLNATLSPTEAIDSSMPAGATLLPEVGNQLPPTAVGIAQIQQQRSVQEATSLNASSVQQMPLTQLKTSASPQQAVISATDVETGVDAELSAIDFKAFKSDKPTYLNSQVTVAKSDVSAAEVITNATRLQQVPLTTSVSNSLSAVQNMNASGAESASSLTSSSILNTGSSSIINNGMSTVIGTHVQNPDWSRQMTDQVSFMVKGGFQQAEIKLNPAHLGPMEIKLSVSDDKASINFVTHHAPVRDAIDSAMPRLRDMLEQQGLSLGDVDVSTQSEQQQANEDLEDGIYANADTDKSDAELEITDQEVIAPVNMEIDSGINLFA